MIFTNCEKSHPYTEGLMYSIPRLNDDRKKLDPIPGAVPIRWTCPRAASSRPGANTAPRSASTRSLS